ncbi:TM0106 family RecB-like putative nuclease [Nostoc sp. UCD121]|uniref:TM0106 family RecB-like putative nuclease n=1 Tax=unclassified Nostoc TaxID=2593658 RepID=UPI001625559A|nr:MULTISPECIES: TM0106 family RecB-like putative nuclease [unclassified Nostoc]MBC1219704.1 TM0106 family RecB-like putative nuclease [Nostoc sp. UCD120]MBC1278857.1 TM0106 family RecB-like putative nuclease [Nostoc sp. UCD121]MBC1298323.1 TM0106 family RecB-like putative nuclease [Nostoc sp. UCD122]
MLINAELLLQYQRCKRRTFLDIHGDKSQRDAPNELLRKLQQDKIAHQLSALAQMTYHQPDYSYGNWEIAEQATLELMERGVEYIYKGVLLANYSDEYTLLSRPNLLVKQPGQSRFGDWMYVPASIELGKRPKQEYQVVAAFHTQVLATVQGVVPEAALLILRTKNTNYTVDLFKWIPRMQQILEEFIEVLELPTPPEVFISRQKCNFCHWYSQCYAIAQSEKHLSLLPGVTPLRYTQLQDVAITTLESLANTSPSTLENLVGFDPKVAPKLVVQAQSALEKRPLVLPYPLPIEDITFTAPIELYFDIEAQPDLDLNYLLGVLVVDRLANTERFYSFLADKPEDEELVWQQFLDLVWQYPEAPIYHFCVYEFDTVKRLAKLYNTPYASVRPVLNRFVDVYEQLTQSVALPVESYALKAIARWLGFEWREKEASGAKCIYWYDQWLETGDRTLLEIIQSYNEDDCRATHRVKDWLVNFFQEEYGLRLA